MTGPLSETLGYKFRDESLLRRALTHAGADSEGSNERLEFLGDRVLALVVSENLYHRYPHEAEGALTRRVHALVRWEACARIGEQIGLWEHLVLTRSEAAGGRARGPILGSACEAVIAALYLDGGMEAARGFIEFERERRATIAASHLEIKGSLALGDFTLTGVADRIDILNDGGCAILDYKTGAIPTLKQVEQLLSPQLPLEAAMLAQGGFPGIGKRIAEDLIYLSLASEKLARAPRHIKDAAALAGEAVAQLARRIAWFQEQSTAYRPRVRPYRADIAGDYDHLSRVREWSPSGWSEE